MRVLEGERLKLRPLNQRDAAGIARLISDWEVIRWLTSPLWPYSLADAEAFIGSPASDKVYGIALGDRIIGSVGTDDGLGYWLGRPFWGRGLMTEAARLLLADHFARCDDTVTSGYIPGNTASAKVLAKLGFRPTHREMTRSVPLGRDVDLQKLCLDAEGWRR